MDIQLAYLAKPAYGGWVTFTEHLARVLEQPYVVKIAQGGKTSTTARTLQGRVKYLNYAIQDIARKRSKRIIVTAVDKAHISYLEELLKTHGNVGLVIHDPTELSVELQRILGTYQMELYTIRKSVQDLLKNEYGRDSTYLKHPYVRRGKTKGTKIRKAVSTSRIDFDKHTELLIEANEIEPVVDIYGEPNRIYTYHKIGDERFKKHWKGRFGKHDGAVFELLDPVAFMVDMSAIKKDGAGTQYTFLEAIDANCALILNKAWFDEVTTREALEPNVNCYTAGSGKDIVEVIRNADPNTVNAEAQKILAEHTYSKEQMERILGGRNGEA